MTTQRQDPPPTGTEVELLLGYLDYHRDTLRMKTEGLDARQLDTPLPPSDLTLGGMLKHLAMVEEWWFACVLHGHEAREPWASVDWRADEDWDWHSASDDSPEELRALLDGHVADSDRLLALALEQGDLDQLAQRKTHGERVSLRYILIHMIEEYARHNGHADLILQAVDGSVGE